MDISGISKPALLAALFNASKQQGFGLLDSRGQNQITEEEAAKIIEAKGSSFDYLRGRVMKVSLAGDELRTALYNRDNGPEAEERVIEALRARK